MNFNNRTRSDVIDMLSSAGVGVAMNNAHADVKAGAAFSCSSNDEDGVAEWIASTLI